MTPLFSLKLYMILSKKFEKEVGRFYLLPKVHKRMYHIPGGSVISNCGFYTENISAFENVNSGIQFNNKQNK